LTPTGDESQTGNLGLAAKITTSTGSHIRYDCPARSINLYLQAISNHHYSYSASVSNNQIIEEEVRKQELLGFPTVDRPAYHQRPVAEDQAAATEWLEKQQPQLVGCLLKPTEYDLAARVLYTWRDQLFSPTRSPAMNPSRMSMGMFHRYHFQAQCEEKRGFRGYFG
jgi:hypothetical protein